MANSRSLTFVITGNDKLTGTLRKAAKESQLATSDISRSFHNAGKSAESSAGLLSRSFSGMTSTMRAAASLAAKAIVPVGAAMGAAAFQGVKYAASLEQSQMAFTTMLGSATKAQSFLRELQGFAAKTPFNLPDVVKASQQLMAFGFNAKDVIPTLTAIGDAASGLGVGAEGIERITIAIGQMSAKGKVQSDEILQLTENGVPALRILANEYGVSAAKMQEMITAGAVSADKAIPLLLKGLEKGTKGAAGTTAAFAGMMKNQSTTLTGMWSNFVDTANMRLAQLVQPAIPYIKKGIGWLTDTMSGKGPLGGVLASLKSNFAEAFKSALPAIKDIASNVSSVLMPVLSGIGDFLSTSVAPMFSKVFGAARDAISNLAPLAKDIGKWFVAEVLPALKDVADFFTAKIVPMFSKFFKFAAPGFRDLFKAIKSIFGSLKILWDALKPIIGPLVELGLAKIVLAFRAITWVLANVVAPAIRGFSDALAAVFKWAPGAAKAAWDAISGAFTWMWNSILRPAIKALWDVISGVFGSIVHGAAVAFSWVPVIGDKLKGADRAFQSFKDSVNASLSGINDQTVNVRALIAATPYAGAANGGQYIGGGANAAHRAFGGPVHGPGTSMSDSIPAWLSDDEYVVRASAHRKYGTAFLNMINAGKFAGGGPVSFSIAAHLPDLRKFTGSIMGIITQKASSMFAALFSGDVGGSGVTRWSGLVLQVLAMLRQSAAWLGTVLHRIMVESGGNPYAINLWDVNARNGDPSRGLMQTIGATFNAYAGPFRGLGIYNPLANIYAGLNYALHRYGTLAALNRRGGYDHGGYLMPGYTLAYNGTGKPERVPDPRDSGGNTYSITVNVGTTLATKKEIGQVVADSLKYFQDHGGHVPYPKR